MACIPPKRLDSIPQRGSQGTEPKRNFADCPAIRTRSLLTISLSTLGSGTLANNTLILEVEVPALGLALVVGQGESEDGLGGLDGISALSSIGLESVVDDVERSGGGEVICRWNRLRLESGTNGWIIDGRIGDATYQA